MLWARADGWQLAVFRGACALRSLLLCVRLEQWGSTIAYRLLCTSAGRGTCTAFHGHQYQYLHRSASYFILLSWYSTRSYVQLDYCFAVPPPPALASPSDICVCLASGHQLELDFNTATDRQTLLNCQQVWKTDVKGSSVTSVIPPPIIFLHFLHFFHPWQSHYHICIFQARISPTEGREQKVQFELFKLPTNSRIFVYTSTQKAKLGTRQLY